MIAAIAVENESDQKCVKSGDLNIGIEYAGTALSAIFYSTIKINKFLTKIEHNTSKTKNNIICRS